MKNTLLFLLIYLTPYLIIAQKKNVQVDILNAQDILMEPLDGGMVKNLRGKVILKHKGTTMYMDTATVFPNNNIEAKGNIYIKTSKGVTITGNRLSYISQLDLATVSENVVMKQKNTTLKTAQIAYEMSNEIGYYYTSGVITHDSALITSNSGKFFTQENRILFYHMVRVEHPKYKLTSDSLSYWTSQKQYQFHQNTHIFQDTTHIYCQKGFYEEEKEIFRFSNQTLIQQPKSFLIGDSIMYDKKNQFARFYKHFEYHDTIEKIHLIADTGVYFQSLDLLLAYHRPMLVLENFDSATMVMKAERFRISTVNQRKSFLAEQKVRAYHKKFQFVCDSFFYEEIHQRLSLHKSPFVYNDSSQMNAKHIDILLEDKQISHMNLYDTASMIQLEINKNLNQILSDTLYIKFAKGQIQNIFGTSKSQTIYFAKDKNQYQGMNRSKSDQMKILFKLGKIDQIRFYQKPEMVFYPMNQVNATNAFLEEVRNNFDQKPKNALDL
ncbi:MAG: hypothetical protein MUE53_06160 [Chitinophagales bacterium]|jgi:lipopolysaccharide export system protein LptA|nr:hypothetical protein [Chitinophagales bacterium]